MFTGRGRISQWMTLDVLSSIGGPSNSKSSRPVLLYIHGGGWCIGDKMFAMKASLERVASRGVVCCVANYRMSPTVPWPAQIIDSKRALIWVKQHVHEYGGDPDLVFVSGESAGGHLSSLLTVTANEPRFQPPEAQAADTSVRGCVDIYGVHDWTDSDGHLEKLHPPIIEGMGLDGGMRSFIERFIMQKPYRKNVSEFEDASPVHHVRRMIAATERPEHVPPPIMVVHGTKDALAAYNDSREFFAALSQLRAKWGAPGAEARENDIWVSLDGGHHAFGYLTAPRAIALGDAMAEFIYYHARRLGMEPLDLICYLSSFVHDRLTLLLLLLALVPAATAIVRALELRMARVLNMLEQLVTRRNSSPQIPHRFSAVAVFFCLFLLFLCFVVAVFSESPSPGSSAPAPGTMPSPPSAARWASVCGEARASGSSSSVSWTCAASPSIFLFLFFFFLRLPRAPSF